MHAHVAGAVARVQPTDAFQELLDGRGGGSERLHAAYLDDSADRAGALLAKITASSPAGSGILRIAPRRRRPRSRARLRPSRPVCRSAGSPPASAARRYMMVIGSATRRARGV